MNATARITTLTRLGFAARGLLYIVIAVLLLRTGRAEDPSGALRYLGEGGGRLLLLAMAAGLVAYGIWRAVDAAFNIERHSPDNRGLIERAGAAASGLVHLTLAWQAIRLFRGVASASGGGAQEGAQSALALPGGSAALALFGAILVGTGAYQLVKAVKGSFLRHLEPEVARQEWAKWSGRLGYAARGLIFIISSGFLINAGLKDRASEAGGMPEALAWLTSPWDVAVAVGLLFFGLFSLIEARFRILHDVPVADMARRATHKRPV